MNEASQETLQKTLDRYRANVGKTSKASLLDSVRRMKPVLIMVCNPHMVKTEYEKRKSISLEEKIELEQQLQRFLQNTVGPLATFGMGIEHMSIEQMIDMIGEDYIPILESEVGEAYKRILEIATPWKSVWGNSNVYKLMMLGCSPHPIYGYPVKLGL